MYQKNVQNGPLEMVLLNLIYGMMWYGGGGHRYSTTQRRQKFNRQKWKNCEMGQWTNPYVIVVRSDWVCVCVTVCETHQKSKMRNLYANFNIYIMAKAADFTANSVYTETRDCQFLSFSLSHRVNHSSSVKRQIDERLEWELEMVSSLELHLCFV